jgi:hypothetical protein
MIPVSNLSMLILAFKLETIDDGVLDDVTQGVVGVVGGVRADNHIRQFL